MKKLLFTYLLICSANASAMVLDWTGGYRIEGVQLDNAEMDTGHRDTSYILNHLHLKPKIIASDGLIIYSRLDFFNNSNARFANSQMGQFFGQGPRTGAVGTSTSERDSNSLAQHQAAEQIRISELYLTAISEYGQLIVGRKFFHFGLGISHNDGSGLFDHWYDSRDMLAYKMSTGNFNFTPIFAKVNEGNLNTGDDINDFIFQVDYLNPETDIRFGIIYESRVATSGNDAPAGTDGFGGAGGALQEAFNGQRLNLFYQRKFEALKIGFEAATNTGETGVKVGSNDVALSGFGVATEIEYAPANSLWAYSIKAGYASGDDPATNDKYEGFIFDRNYNIGFLLGNYVVGSYNLLRTSLGRTNNNSTVSLASNFADEESISNMIYFVPQVDYHWKSNLDLGLRFVWARLNAEPVANSGLDLGYEIDLNLKYKASEKLVWLNEIGFLLPGNAFAGGANNYPKEMGFGMTTKAAISF